MTAPISRACMPTSFLTTPTASRVGPERGTDPKPANRGPFQTLKVPDQGYPARALNRFPWDTATLDFEISPARIIIASGGDPPEISGALGLPHRQPRLGQPHLPSRYP